MPDDTVFRQLAFDFGQAVRDGPSPKQALYEMFGPLSGVFQSIFERMEIADQVIEEKMASHPLQTDPVDRAFPLLCGTEVLERAPHWL